MNKEVFFLVLNSMIKSLSDIDPSIISDKSTRELVQQLLNILECQQAEISKLKKENQCLKDEINRLKGEQGKPDIKPNSGNKNKDISSGGRERGKGKKGKKTTEEKLKIDKTITVEIDTSKLPKDIVFKGFQERVCQDIKFERHNICYKLPIYYSPSENKTYCGELPSDKSYHSNGLKSFIILMNKICDVTSSKLLLLLKSMGIKISAGSLSSILLAHTAAAVAEKEAILKAGLAHSYAQTDITGARVQGQNHYTHIICNEYFTIYSTLNGKSILDVLTAFQGLANKKNLLLCYNEECIALLKKEKVSKSFLLSLSEYFKEGDIYCLEDFEKFIKQKIPDLFQKKNIFKKVKLSFALSYYHLQNDFLKVNCLLSDNAPEYRRIASHHALCWVHDARPYNKITPHIKIHRDYLTSFQSKYWDFYDQLLDYKLQPSQERATELSLAFDALFTTSTGFHLLDKQIEKTYNNKQKLLQVLQFPEIPLHNNLAELGARRQVRKRDISLHTMTQEGTQNQDAFLSIGQTAMQLGVDVFKYLKEFLAHKIETPLASIILQKIAQKKYTTAF